MSGPLLLVAASGLAREVLPVVRESGRDVLGILDDRHRDLPRTVGGAPLLGAIDDVPLYPDAELLVCAGSGAARERIVARIGVDAARYATVVDPSVRNPGASPIGPGSIVLANSVLTADAIVGSHVVIMPGVTITHDCLVEDYATFAAGAALGGAVRVGRGAYVGMNASVRQGLVVGAAATIGMGAVVLGDVPDGETWAGVPARRLQVMA